MPRGQTTVEFTIRYDPAENGWLTASIPSVPGTISMGRTRAEARANVLDAFVELLATDPDASRVVGGRAERV